MNETPELVAARALLATFEAARGALLGLASTHLPFDRALAVHRAVAAGGADIVTSADLAHARADLLLRAWRRSPTEEQSGGEAPPIAPPRVEPPKVEAPKVESVRVEPPRAEPASVAPPEVEAPKAEPVRVEPPPMAEPPKIEAPKAEPVRVETPVVEVQKPVAPVKITAAPGKPAVPSRPNAAVVEPTPVDTSRITPPRAVEPHIEPPRTEPARPVAAGFPKFPPPAETPRTPPVAAPAATERVERPSPRPAEPSPDRRASPFGDLPFEPISELEYVDDDPSEVTQVARVSLPPLAPTGNLVPGRGTGDTRRDSEPRARGSEPPPLRAEPARSGFDTGVKLDALHALTAALAPQAPSTTPAMPAPSLAMDDFNDISELEELDPGDLVPPVSPHRAEVPTVRDARGQRPSAEPRGNPKEDMVIIGEDSDLPYFDGPGGEADDLSLSFELGSQSPERNAAPRLTDDDDGYGVQEQTVAPRPVNKAADAALIQKAMADAAASVNRGDLARAIQFYTDALDITPGKVEAHIGRGRAWLELGDYSSAMSDFQRAEDLSPNDPESHLAMGDLYYNRKEYKRAIDFYDQAVEIDGQHAMAKCKRGLAHYYRKNFRQAFTDLQRAMSLDPNIPNIQKYVQMALRKMDARG